MINDCKNAEHVLKKYRAAIPYLLAFAICLCVSLPVFSQSIVLDEGYSVTLVRNNVQGIIKGAASDVHPPLYYLILKLSSLFGGESFLKYRIATVFAAYLNLIALGATLVRRRWGCRTSVFYLLWFGGSYCTFQYSNLIRMYSWAAFFVAAMTLHLFFCYEEGKIKDYVLAVLMTLAAMYTHYYAVLSALCLWGMTLAVVIARRRERLKGILTAGVCIAAGYLPWAWALFSQTSRVSKDYWISAIGWGEWFASPARMMDCALEGIGTVLYFLVFVLLFTAILRMQKDALLFFCVFAGTMLAGMLVSTLIAPVWQDRYLYVAWGTLSLAAAIVMGKQVSEFSFIAQAACVGILCFALAMSVRTIRQDGVMSSSDKEWVAFLGREVERDALVIVDDPGEHICVYEAYLPNAEFYMTEYLTAEEGRDALRLGLKGAGDRQVWYVIDHVQARLGHEQVSEMLSGMGYETDAAPVAEYTIKDKNLGIYKVEKKANEE